MTPAPRSFAAIATALAVFVVQAACLCHTRAARTTAARPAAASHACCKHKAPSNPVPAPSPPGKSENHCQHCSGFAAAVLKVQSGGVGGDGGLEPCVSPAHAADVVVVTSHSFVSANHVPDPPAVLPSTLLRLHCALNL
jgi:hypothetical protein